MTAVLRNNAALSGGAVVRQTGSGGGSPGAPVGQQGAGKVQKRAYYSRDPAAELMPAAEFLGQETDFQAVLEDFAGSPFDPARRRVLGRLAGVFAMDYQGARAEERHFLRRLLLARNAREGYAANRALHLAGAANIIRRTLALGVAESRFAVGPSTGFLGAVQARLAATTFRLLGPESRETVWNLLTLAGTNGAGRPLAGADRVIERALILKAVAARRHLLGPWSTHGRDALFEVHELAEKMRGQTRDALARLTTLRPAPDARQAAPVAKAPSAAVRAGLLARGDLDPVFAWRTHGSRGEQLTAVSAALPEGAFEALPDLDRNSLLDRPRLHLALAEARLAGGALLPQPLADVLTDYVVGRELLSGRLAKKDEALVWLSKRGFDVVRAGAIEAIRRDAREQYQFDAARALGDLLSRYTGASYLRRVFSDQQTAGTDPLGQIAGALAVGMPVPFTVHELKIPLARAYAVIGCRDDTDRKLFEVHDPSRPEHLEVQAKMLVAPIVGEPLGRQARAEAYMAPAALDLLAPPFGIPFPELGIEDRL